MCPDLAIGDVGGDSAAFLAKLPWKWVGVFNITTKQVKTMVVMLQVDVYLTQGAVPTRKPQAIPQVCSFLG